MARSDDHLNQSRPKETFITGSYLKFVIICVAVIFGFIFIRLFQLQVLDADKNSKAAEESRTVSYTVSPKRGTIYDRNGNVLAVSKEACTVCANPHQIEDKKTAAKTLEAILGGNSNDYYELIKNDDKTFTYIKRKAEIEVADKIKDAKIEGLYTVEDSKREYPYGQIAGQVIGAVNIDGNGLCGLELYYDDVLTGSQGKTIEQRGQSGIPIPGGVVQSTDVVEGQDIMISVDIEIQEKLEQVLSENKQRRGSESTNGLVMDTSTGEILAAASIPLFNPSDISSSESGSTEIKSISSTYEPGSVFKTVTAMAILENGTLKPETEIYCPASINADEYTVSDAHERASQTFTFRQIMERSSNVGISLAAEKLGFDKLFQKINDYKLNDNTGVDFPGDNCGYLPPFDKWSRIAAYNISFGQGVTVTPLQISSFYSAINNDGILVTPHFLLRYLQSVDDEVYTSTEIIKNKQAIATMKDILRGVVTNGTGKQANIEGYGVAGKTGTGQVADSNGKYHENTYYNSFCGMLTQASSPLLCYTASYMQNSEDGTADMFRDIMSFAIDKLCVIPKGE